MRDGFSNGHIMKTSEEKERIEEGERGSIGLFMRELFERKPIQTPDFKGCENVENTGDSERERNIDAGYRALLNEITRPRS